MKNRKGRLALELVDPFYLKDPKLAELYEKCKPPKEAYLYFPQGEEIIELNQKKLGSSYRKIYYEVPILEHEKIYINKLKELIDQHPEIKLPDFFDNELLLRFLYADDCEMDKVFQRISRYIEWSNKTFPLVIQPKSKTIEILNKGFVYVYGRDGRFRPILIFRLVEFVKYEKIYSVQEVMYAGVFLGQFIINNILLPGHIERWDLIINLRKTTLLSLPEHIKKLLPIMNEGFISRSHKTYVIGMNFFFRILYKIVCAFLHESTIKKIKILDGKKDQSMFKEIRKDNIEVDMGGTAPKARLGEENGLFPPRMPSEQFLLETQNPEDILISEEEYVKKYKNGEIHKDLVSPFILNKLKVEEEKKQQIQKKNDNFNNEIKDKLIQKNKTFETNKNHIQNIVNLNKINKNTTNKHKEIFLQKQENLMERKQKISKVKTFMNNGWEFKEESINEDKYKFNFNHQYCHYNIIKEINSLTIKRSIFISNISKISNMKDI